MANTYSQIYIQIVFAVEGRQNLIDPSHNNDLQKYVTGIVTKQRHKLIAVNNIEKDCVVSHDRPIFRRG